MLLNLYLARFGKVVFGRVLEQEIGAEREGCGTVVENSLNRRIKMISSVESVDLDMSNQCLFIIARNKVYPTEFSVICSTPEVAEEVCTDIMSLCAKLNGVTTPITVARDNPTVNLYESVIKGTSSPNHNDLLVYRYEEVLR